MVAENGANHPPYHRIPQIIEIKVLVSLFLFGLRIRRFLFRILPGRCSSSATVEHLIVGASSYSSTVPSKARLDGAFPRNLHSPRSSFWSGRGLSTGWCSHSAPGLGPAELHELRRLRPLAVSYLSVWFGCTWFSPLDSRLLRGLTPLGPVIGGRICPERRRNKTRRSQIDSFMMTVRERAINPTQAPRSG